MKWKPRPEKLGSCGRRGPSSDSLSSSGLSHPDGSSPRIHASEDRTFTNGSAGIRCAKGAITDLIKMAGILSPFVIGEP